MSQRLILTLSSAFFIGLAAPLAAQVIEDDPAAVEDRFPDSVPEAERIRSGANLAQDWCAECHGLGPVASDAAPTFTMIARRDPAALRTFLSRPHPPMPPLVLSNDEIDALIAYLQSLPATLKPQEAGRP